MAAMNIFFLLFACLLLGAFAGTLAGLLGIGGGLIIVPILAALFQLQGFAGDHLMQLAVGTSLASILFTALASAWAHHRHGAVAWPLVWQLAVGIAAGAWAGGWLARWLGGQRLALVFAVFELLVAAQLAFGGAPAAHRRAPGALRNGVAGGGIGLLSALLGIGGGTMTVPWLVWHNLEMRRAVATAAACGLPIALVGSLSFLTAGWNQAGLPAGATGYIYWPAVAAISAASVLGAPLGAHLAHRLPQRRLRHLFAGFLTLLGLWMLYSGLRAA